MRVAGIIAEYNPFHRGHAYHVAETRRRTGCDFVIAAMDGCFTQRGEAALLSKWTRARMALACGVDAVFELPALYAVRPAEIFARGGVALLGGLGADDLSFGCETEDLALLSDLAELRGSEPEALSRAVQARLETGMPHVRAWAEAAAAHLGCDPALLSRPNAILAVEYLRSIRALRPGLRPCAVLRRGAYRGAGLEDPELASASAVRQGLAAGDPRALLAVPEAARALLAADPGGHGLDDALLLRLRELSEAELADLADASEGLDRLLFKACRQAAGREELLSAMGTRRYTQARLSRLLTQALLGITRTLAEAHPLPEYARLLGMRREGEPLLAELKRRSALPIVSGGTALRDHPVFRLECRASDIWALGRNAPSERRAGRDFTEKFIVV